MNEIIAAAGGTFDMTDWILSIPEFAIGLFFGIVTYIGAPIESRKKGRHISGCPGVAFVCFLLGRVDTKPNDASFWQNFTHSALKRFDRRQPACTFLPCLRKIYVRKSAYYFSVNTP